MAITKPDYVLYNAGTRQTAVWYMNNNVHVGGGYGPTLPPGWNLIGVADFNGDGHPDYAVVYTRYWPNSDRLFIRTNAYWGRFGTDSSRWLAISSHRRL